MLTAAEKASREGLSVVVQWTDAAGDASGQLHLTSLVPQPLLLNAPSAPQSGRGPTPSVPAPVAVAAGVDVGATLRIHAHACPLVTHAFGTAPLCVVPVTVVVQNCDRAAAVAFSLELAAPVGQTPTAHGGGAGAAGVTGGGRAAPPSGEPFWLGCTRLTERWVAAGDAVELSLQLAVTAPGTYSLDAFRIALTAWKLQGLDVEAVQPTAPVQCPPPAARTVRVVEG